MEKNPSLQIKALARLISEASSKHGTPLTADQATVAAKAVLGMFDLAGKGTLTALKQWVVERYESGPYADEGGDAANCAAEICC